MTSPTLRRLDETLWSLSTPPSDPIREIRIATPGFGNRTQDYELASRVARAVGESSLDNLIANGVDFSAVTDIDPALRTQWQVKDVTAGWHEELQRSSSLYYWTYHVFYTPFPSVRVRHVEIKPASKWTRLSSYMGDKFRSVGSWFGWKASPVAQGNYTRPLNEERSHLLQHGLYQDSFTQLAAEALRADETPFVAEYAAQGSYRFILRDNQIHLQPLNAACTPEEIKGAVQAHLSFLRATFGWRILDNIATFAQELTEYPRIFSEASDPEEQFLGYLKCTLGIDFAEMLEQGSPLRPDHVFKCNIAANNIEMPMVESLFLRLRHLKEFERQQGFGDTVPLATALQFDQFLERHVPRLFSLREIRGIYCSFQSMYPNNLDSASFKTYLESFKYANGYANVKGMGEKIRDLTPESFHRLMEILYVDTNLANPESTQEDFFTGRKITHLAISGYKTMGDKNIYDPCRNLLELFHLFPQMHGSNEDRYRELLTFIVAKKSLWSHYPLRPMEQLDPTNGHKDRVRRVGRLLPLPSVGDEKRWCYVDGLLNDGNGDVNYVLIPVAKAYLQTPGRPVRDSKRASIIKLYRSTASDPEAERGIDSVLADTNPRTVGSLNFSVGKDYETTYFGRSTMPVWAAYLVIEDVDQAVQYFGKSPQTPRTKDMVTQTTEREKRQLLNRVLSRQILAKHQYTGISELTAEQRAERLIKDLEERLEKGAFSHYLNRTVEGLEWESPKLAQDVIFMGHSLGGALTQSALALFGAQNARVPLFGCKYKCYAYDTPGIAQKEAQAFLEFGRLHQTLLGSINQKWEIHYQLEYKDIVPQGGASFLGASGYNIDSDASWLDVSGHIYRPLSTATDLAITTSPTHGRRFHQAVEGTDYAKDDLSAQELAALKANWFFLPDGLRAKVGYYVTSPVLSNKLFREGLAGHAVHYYFRLKRRWTHFHAPAAYELDKDGVLFVPYKGKTKGFYLQDTHPFLFT